jgi:branched-chain amino acid transport system ATP-binding protein
MPLLEVSSVDAYHSDLQALFGVSMELGVGEIVALIGANGAGKSTLLNTLVGLVPCRKGEIRFASASIGSVPAERVARLGISLVPEGRMLFPSLSVEENLQMGAVSGRRGAWDLARIYNLFPILRDFRKRPATRLSGGQQQMVAIGRALMANPRVLLCDEVSLGLAPGVISEVYEALARIRSEGIAVVLVEQDVARARSAADRVYCLLKGRVTLAGRARDLTGDAIARAYFGH